MQTEDNSIIGETIATIGTILGPELDEITVERAVVGLFFTGVKLGNGIAIVELGQHTASGIDLIGVALAPAAPLLSLTPVKNSPTTALSIVISSSSGPTISPIKAIVSPRIELFSVFITALLPPWASILTGAV